MAENKDKNIGPLSSKNDNTGLNRRKVLKKILAATPLVAGLPLSISAWGQPVSFSDQSISSAPMGTDRSSPTRENVEHLVSVAPTSAPTEICTYCPTMSPTCFDFITFAPTSAPTALPK